MHAPDSTPSSATTPLPHLRTVSGSDPQLVVDGTPFLVLGGELHNSSSSDLASLEPIWERLVTLGLNTVLAAVSWELVEPEEGTFDWTLVDGLIADARQHGLRLILLWFGSWKNGQSTYVPLWVKRDYCPLSARPAPGWAGRRGAVALCRGKPAGRCAGLRDTAGSHSRGGRRGAYGDHGAGRERGRAAGRLAGPLSARRGRVRRACAARPDRRSRGASRRAVARAARALGGAGVAQDGSWEALFGTGPETDELFMAWHYARYIDAVAAAGKAEYGLPMFVNAWLNAVVDLPGLPAGGTTPGDWPSGGPLPHTMDIWRAGAPHIDLLSPDIYFGSFFDWCRQYTRRGNALFIPEMRRDAEGARNLFHAIGLHDAIGVSPFGIELAVWFC